MLHLSCRLTARSRLHFLRSLRAPFGSLNQERVLSNTALQPFYKDEPLNFNSHSFVLLPRRFYADGAVSRPKAHTGRTRTKAASKSSNAAPKAKGTTKTKIKTKTKAKKPVKAKAKARPKKKVLTEKQQAKKVKSEESQAIQDLKKKALLNPPKQASGTAWLVFNSERNKAALKGIKEQTKTLIGPKTTENASLFRELSPEQIEHYNHVANQNKRANEAAYRTWITSYTPKEIYDANVARKSLARRLNKQYSNLKDERLVRRPTTAYIAFYKSRYASGDFKGLKVVEASRLIGREYKALSAAEKKASVPLGISSSEDNVLIETADLRGFGDTRQGTV